MAKIAETVVKRATPADPMPGSTVDRSIPSPKRRNLPPELGPNAIAILEGRTFLYSDAVGDVTKGSIGGLIHADTRFLDQWLLTVDGERLLALRSGTVDHYSAAFFLTNPQMAGLAPNTLGIRRLRFVGDGLHERIEVSNYVEKPVNVELRLAVGTDFADLFEVKDVVRDRSAQIVRDHAPDGARLAFRYANKGFDAETVVEVSTPPDRLDGDDFVWDLALPPRGEWTCDVRVPLRLGPNEIQPLHRDFGEAFAPEGADPVSRWLEQIPRFESDSQLLTDVIAKSARDILALRIEVKTPHENIVLPAAGLPWFLTLFGRDTLLTSYQLVAFGPRIARGALIALGTLQGTKMDDFRDEEPGKIPHELRAGELTRLELKPHSPYYGTADATILWLTLLSEYWRWTRDDEFVVSLRDNALAALRWIDEYGDLDGDGYVEYATRSSQGLGNQCWRDSWDGIQFADGTIPPLPIATCEIQGYVYDAKQRLAELADGPLADPALATRLRAEAQALQERFDRDFWIDDRGGYYAIGLDGDKRRIDSMTSNIGQLLWTGIVPRGASRGHRGPPDVRCAPFGLGCPHALDRRPRVQPDRLPPRDGMAARQLDHRHGARSLRVPGRGEPDRDATARGCGVLWVPAAGGLLGIRAIGRPVPDPLPDGLQPAGVGDRDTGRARPSHARPGRGRWRTGAGPAPTRSDRSRLHRRSAGLREAMGHRGDRVERPYPARALTSGRR